MKLKDCLERVLRFPLVHKVRCICVISSFICVSLQTNAVAYPEYFGFFSLVSSGGRRQSPCIRACTVNPVYIHLYFYNSGVWHRIPYVHFFPPKYRSHFKIMGVIFRDLAC